MLFNDYASDTLIAGVDEVGRGAYFGPVVAAAVVVPLFKLSQLTELGVKDSKLLSAKKRSQLTSLIEDLAEDCQIAYATVTEIDELNILQASLLAMKRAVNQLQVQPTLCLVDGNQAIPNLNLPQKTIVQGDRQSPVIAAASIMAKVWRDQLLLQLATEYPSYDLAANKGYGTKKHREALQKYGTSSQHRLSFKLIKSS